METTGTVKSIPQISSLQKLAKEILYILNTAKLQLEGHIWIKRSQNWLENVNKNYSRTSQLSWYLWIDNQINKTVNNYKTMFQLAKSNLKPQVDIDMSFLDDNETAKYFANIASNSWASHL